MYKPLKILIPLGPPTTCSWFIYQLGDFAMMENKIMDIRVALSKTLGCREKWGG